MKIRRCLFTFFIKHEIRHFHVVIVKKRQRNVQKKAKVVVLLIAYPLFFFRRSPCRSVVESFKTQLPSSSDSTTSFRSDDGNKLSNVGSVIHFAIASGLNLLQ